MNDKYISLANGPLKKIVKTLGLPAPVPLRRFDPADSSHGYLSEPILVLGETSGADALSQLLLDNGFSVHRTPNPGLRYQAIIAAYDGLTHPDQLQDTTLAIGSALRQLTKCGRVITVADAGVVFPHTTDADPALNAVRNAVTGITRSLAHEMRAGSTANGIVLDGVQATAPSAVAALWFLLSAKSAYVSGQFLTVSSDRGTTTSAAEFAATGQTGPLNGAVAVVTGAARGIGAEIARVLHRDGAQVYGVDVPQAGQALAQTMNSIGGVAIQLDITAEDAGQQIMERVGVPIDILIHNAGITRDKLLANMDESRWASAIAVNISSQLRINETITAADGWGEAPRVVSLASIAGLAGNRGQTNYSASKAGVVGMVAAGAEDFAARSGTINAVAPGFIETDMTAAMPMVPRELGRRLSSLQQGGKPRDVAEAIAFFAQPAAGGINGKTLRVCGQSLLGA